MAQLLAHLPGQALGLAAVDLTLSDPGAQRFSAAAEVVGDLLERQAGGTQEAHRLTTELGRIRWM
jgi:hypothetical protein